MKRLDLVQLTIIIVGIFSAFNMISLVPAFLFYLFSWFSDGLRGGYLMESFIENIVLISIYLIVAIYAIKNSKHFATWISNKAGLHSDIDLALNKTELLFALFTGLGVYGLVKTLPAFLTNAYHYIKNSNRFSGSPELTYDVKGPDIAIQVITLLLFFTLVYYANVFADFLSAKINNPEPDEDISNNTTT